MKRSKLIIEQIYDKEPPITMDKKKIKAFIREACGVCNTLCDAMDANQLYDSEGNKIKMDAITPFHRAIDALDRELVPKEWYDE